MKKTIPLKKISAEYHHARDLGRAINRAWRALQKAKRRLELAREAHDAAVIERVQYIIHLEKEGFRLP